MNTHKTISPKLTALAFGVLAVSFLAVFYVVAWTEPSQAPPQGSVATPLNTGNVGQSKEGGLILNTGGLATSNGLVVDKGNLCIGTDCRSVWPGGTGVPSGMIAMFDTSCPGGWTRFAALDNRFPQGAATYGVTGGSLGKTTTGHQHTTPFGFRSNFEIYLPNSDPYGSEGIADVTEYVQSPGGAGAAIHSSRMKTKSATDSITDIRPPYLDVIWCKKN